jgi:membrane associated rhomboid family serine protease
MFLTVLIIALTVIISIASFTNVRLFDRLKFNAYDARHSNQWYRFFTYGFVHAGWVHLFINMFVLYSFGRIVELNFRMLFPEKDILYFLLLYIGALILSIIPSFGKHRNDVFYNAVGASGAVSAIVFTSILLYPSGKIFLFLIPIGIPAPLFGVFYVVYEAYMSRRGGDNIGHDAHLWGALYGLVFPILLKPGLVLLFLEQLGISV